MEAEGRHYSGSYSLHGLAAVGVCMYHRSVLGALHQSGEESGVRRR